MNSPTVLRGNLRGYGISNTPGYGCRLMLELGATEYEWSFPNMRLETAAQFLAPLDEMMHQPIGIISYKPKGLIISSAVTTIVIGNECLPSELFYR